MAYIFLFLVNFTFPTEMGKGGVGGRGPESTPELSSPIKLNALKAAANPA